jgi:hypothetical protein
MRNLQFRELSLASGTLVMAAVLTLTGCSSSGGTSSPTSSASTATSQPATSSAPATGGPSEPATGAGATAAIKANWVAFFNPKTPTARRIALLEHGDLFAAVIKGQAGSPLAALATARVDKVTLTGTEHAGVVYDILTGGQVALANQNGVAVYEDGIWKVGDESFCGLLKLENGGGSSGLPVRCKS